MKIKKLYSECDKLIALYRRHPGKENREELDDDYKAMVLIILPWILSLSRAFLFLLSPIAGFFLYMFIRVMIGN